MAERRIRIRWDPEDCRWTWTCRLCSPTARGGTSQFERTLRNVERHCRVRRAHHEWVRKNRKPQ